MDRKLEEQPKARGQLGRVVIVGVGLIGGSIGKALRLGNRAEAVVGVGRTPESLQQAKALGAIDEIAENLESAVEEAELVVVCTPVSRIASDVASAAAHCRRDALIMDVGSTKSAIVRDVEANAAARDLYVGAHPIAGSERGGVEAAKAELFVDRVCVLTPTAATNEGRIARARSFWACLGSSIIETSPDEHDRLVAFSSHLPHAVASALASCAPDEAIALAGASFRDGTRVAASSAELWSAIFLANQDNLAKALVAFRQRLENLESALELQDQPAIEQWWLESQKRLESASPLFKRQSNR